MVETRGMGVAAPQTSFWVVAMLLISIGIEMLWNAGGDFNREVLGMIVVVLGVVVILLKYFLKLPDVSPEEMEKTIADIASAYERFLFWASDVYHDVHTLRDEVIKHRLMVEAFAKTMPASWQEKLKGMLDALEGKYKVDTSTRPA